MNVHIQQKYTDALSCCLVYHSHCVEVYLEVEAQEKYHMTLFQAWSYSDVAKNQKALNPLQFSG